jgi:hypothetical protein
MELRFKKKDGRFNSELREALSYWGIIINIYCLSGEIRFRFREDVILSKELLISFMRGKVEVGNQS